MLQILSLSFAPPNHTIYSLAQINECLKFVFKIKIFVKYLMSLVMLTEEADIYSDNHNALIPQRCANFEACLSIPGQMLHFQDGVLPVVCKHSFTLIVICLKWSEFSL